MRFTSRLRISAARRSGRDDFPVDQRPLRTRKHHSHFEQELRRMGLDLWRPDHRDCDPRPPAPSFNDGEHPRRKLPAERAPQSRADSASGSTTARIFCCRPDRSRQTEPFVMSFFRHRQIYQSDVFFASERRRGPSRLRPRSIVLMSLRPAIPWRVGLHQSPPPLHQPVPFSTRRLKL
jgi:hypothetical protein